MQVQSPSQNSSFLSDIFGLPAMTTIEEEEDENKSIKKKNRNRKKSRRRVKRKKEKENRKPHQNDQLTRKENSKSRQKSKKKQRTKSPKLERVNENENTIYIPHNTISQESDLPLKRERSHSLRKTKTPPPRKTPKSSKTPKSGRTSTTGRTPVINHKSDRKHAKESGRNRQEANTKLRFVDNEAKSRNFQITPRVEKYEPSIFLGENSEEREKELRREEKEKDKKLTGNRPPWKSYYSPTIEITTIKRSSSAMKKRPEEKKQEENEKERKQRSQTPTYRAGTKKIERRFKTPKTIKGKKRILFEREVMITQQSDREWKDLYYREDLEMRGPLFQYKREKVEEELLKNSQKGKKKKKSKKKKKLNLPSHVRKLPSLKYEEYRELNRRNELEVDQTTTFSLLSNKVTGHQYVLSKDKYIRYLKAEEKDRKERKHRAIQRGTRLNQYSAKYGWDSQVNHQEVIVFTNRIIIGFVRRYVDRFRFLRKLRAIRRIQRWYRQVSVPSARFQLKRLVLTQRILKNIWLEGGKVEEVEEELVAPTVKLTFQDHVEKNIEQYRAVATFCTQHARTTMAMHHLERDLNRVVLLQSIYRSNLIIRLTDLFTRNEYVSMKKKVLVDYARTRARYARRAVFLYKSKQMNPKTLEYVRQEMNSLKSMKQAFMSESKYRAHLNQVRNVLTPYLKSSSFVQTLVKVYAPKILQLNAPKKKSKKKVPNLFSIFRRSKTNDPVFTDDSELTDASTTTPNTPITAHNTKFARYAQAKASMTVPIVGNSNRASFGDINESIVNEATLSIKTEKTKKKKKRSFATIPGSPHVFAAAQDSSHDDASFLISVFQDHYPDVDLVVDQRDRPLLIQIPSNMKYVASLEHLPPKYVLDTVVKNMFHPSHSVNRLNWSSVIMFKYALNNQTHKK